MKTMMAIMLLVATMTGFWNGFHVTGVGQQDNFVGPDPRVIPAHALRFRVIANSNQPQDQAVKRQIRNRVIAYIGPRLDRVTSLTQAKVVLAKAIPAVEAIATSTLRAAHMPYGAATALGPTVFPTKLYGNKVYPAGTYEALRITLGQGAGQNWWCVLFPPLCFVAMSDGDAVAATKAFPDYPPLATSYVKAPDGKEIPVALRLAVVDYGSEWWHQFANEAANLYRMIT